MKRFSLLGLHLIVQRRGAFPIELGRSSREVAFHFGNPGRIPRRSECHAFSLGEFGMVGVLGSNPSRSTESLFCEFQPG